MQQRRRRLGDILDDYCPRERRITNHAVVAMIEDEVKQVRCTTCDADHEYRQAKVPLSRKRKRDDVPLPESAEAPLEGMPLEAEATPADMDDQSPPVTTAFDDAPDPAFAADEVTDEPEPIEDEGPVHRRLIRATLPRPEGQAPERKAPDFTMRQPGGRFDQNRGGQRQRGRQARHPQKASGGQQARFGGPRQGGGSGNSQGQRQGNRFGNSSGQRGGPPQGAGRGERHGGQGRKRGR